MVWEAAADLRHDLRNKLAAVRNANFYIRRKVTTDGAAICERDARIPRFFELIGTELAAAETIISGRLPNLPPAAAETASSDADLIRIAADAVAAAAAPEGVRIALPDAAIHVHGDRTELTIALLCLIENAIEAVVDAGGGSVTIAAARRDEHAVLEVLDDGGGMTPEVAGRAGEQLFTTRAGRLGLGLAVARRLAGRAGGTLEIGNRDGARGVRAALVLRAVP